MFFIVFLTSIISSHIEIYLHMVKSYEICSEQAN